MKPLRSGEEADLKQSTRKVRKYRRDSEIIIVIHDGKGWFDPLSDANSDVFWLIEHLQGVGFVEAVNAVTGLVGFVSIGTRLGAGTGRFLCRTLADPPQTAAGLGDLTLSARCSLHPRAHHPNRDCRARRLHDLAAEAGRGADRLCRLTARPPTPSDLGRVDEPDPLSDGGDLRSPSIPVSTPIQRRFGSVPS